MGGPMFAVAYFHMIGVATFMAAMIIAAVAVGRSSEKPGAKRK